VVDLLAERDAIELIQYSAMEALTDSIGLRALGLGAAVINVLDGEVPLGKSSIAVRSDLTICGGSPRSTQSSNLATSSPSSRGLSGPPRFTITASRS
jgi:hypothetical protein